MLTAKSAWSTAAPSKAVLIPALQNAHGQVSTVHCKNTPGGKKLAESTGAIEKNNDNKNVRNGIMNGRALALNSKNLLPQLTFRKARQSGPSVSDPTTTTCLASVCSKHVKAELNLNKQV